MSLSFELQEPLAQLLQALGGGLELQDMPLMRARLNALCETAADTPPFDLHVLSDSASLLEYRPAGFKSSDAAAGLPALLWCHGGGYVMGKAMHDAALCQRFSQALGIRVFSLDYPLAPEHPYPCALVAAEQAWDWMTRELNPVQGLPRMAVGGASAGGGLAASLALRLRDRAKTSHPGAVQPCLQWLMYPMLDARTPLNPSCPEAHLWTLDCNRRAWQYLLDTTGPGRKDLPTSVQLAMSAHPYYSPSQIGDLSGLPPVFMATGSIDLFYAENRTYADRLIQAGVPCDFHEFAQAPHAFDAFAPQAQASILLETLRCDRLHRALHLGR